MQNTYLSEKIYKEIVNIFPIPTLDILFLNKNGQILLGKRNNEPLKGVFYLPGGRVRKNETQENAAQRIFQSEIGINITNNKLTLLGVYDDIYENSAFKNITIHCIPTTYFYKLSSKEERILSISDTQHSSIQFFDLDDEALHENIKLRIKDYIKFNI